MGLLSEIWGILTPAQRRAVIMMQLVSLTMALSTATGVAAIAPFFAVLGDPRLAQHNAILHWLYLQGGFSGTRSFMTALGIGFVAVVLTANLIGILGLLAINRLARRIGNELQATLFGEYLAWPYASHIATNSTTLFNNVIYETSRVTVGLLQQSFILVTNGVTAVLIVVSLLLLKPLVAIVMATALGSGYVLIYLFVRRRLVGIGRNQSRFAVEQAQVVTESLGGIKEIIVLRAQAFFREKFTHSSKGFLLAVSQAQVVGQTPRYVMECVAAVGLVSIALLLSAGGGGVGPLLGLLTFLAFAAYRLLPTLQQVFASIVRVHADKAALSLISTDLRRARATRRVMTLAGPACADNARTVGPLSAIQLREVSYRYVADRPWALQGLSMRIPARATVGIVGANGSGKSTLMDVIAGLLVPASGVLEVDGCAVDDENRAAWQSRIAYVPENSFLLDASIAENVAFGVAAVEIDRAQLLQAARLARLDEFVVSLPLGYEQRVGQCGLALSRGQRQRIGIARALYREAAVLLMDEATSALDGLTEQELLTTVGSLRGRYTIVLIAHRMSTVRDCDLIFHLERGRVVGSGSYEGLLQSSRGFRQMAGIR